MTFLCIEASASIGKAGLHNLSFALADELPPRHQCGYRHPSVA
nr:hypothetical protein JVH1_3793 [Rhodococcus sp. JVH1]